LGLGAQYEGLFGNPTASEWQGLMEWDAERSYLALADSDEEPMDQLRGHSIPCRSAVGPQQGRKVFTLQTLPERDPCESSSRYAVNTAVLSS